MENNEKDKEKEENLIEKENNEQEQEEKNKEENKKNNEDVDICMNNNEIKIIDNKFENKNEKINKEIDDIKFEKMNDGIKTEIKKEDNEEIENSIICYTKSDVELFPRLLDQNDLDEIEENEKMKEFLNDSKHRFRNINPLRIGKSEYEKKNQPEGHKKTKQMAIKELVTNLKTQYIIFRIRDFIRKYQINANPYISRKTYKTIRILRNTCLYLYGIIMLFERPWFCYKGTTIPIYSSIYFIEDCEKKIEFVNIPFLYNDLLRAIEIIQTIIIIVTQIMKYKDEYNLKKTNTGVNKIYNIIQIILFISLFLSLVDQIISLSNGKFPIINFILRPFIYIYMIRRLRLNWYSMLKVIWKTKKAYFVLSFNMIVFSVIGYILFKKEKGFFESFGESVLQLYILLSTCNFPDIMLEAMEISKFAIIYFILYISINYFIILSYLKTLYTTKYYEVNKRDCLDIIKNIIGNVYNKHIFKGRKFSQFILKQKRVYKLNEDEYNNFLILFNLYDKFNDTFTELERMVLTTPEMEMVEKTKYGKYILKSKKFEILINILCIISTPSLFSENIFFLIFQFLISVSLLYEPIILTKNLGVRRFIVHHLNRIIFHVFNLVVLICTITLFFLDQDNEEQKLTFNFVLRILRIFISLRTIRLFVFLDKFEIIKNIYIIIRVSKEMLYRNLLLLYSFILLFSTLSMILTGGNIKKNSFEDKDDPIPESYVYINFNDFASSYIACFCLIMINNLNILVKSLTYQLRNKMFFQFYFATFYFISTLIIINIIQTLLLEMYLISGHSLSDKHYQIKEEEEKIKQKNNEKIFEEDSTAINNGTNDDEDEKIKKKN